MFISGAFFAHAQICLLQLLIRNRVKKFKEEVSTEGLSSMGTNASNRMVVCEANRANGVREVVVDEGLHRVAASKMQGKGASSSTSIVTISTRKL